MTDQPEPTKRPQRRSTGLGDTCTVQLRLTTPQADWLRSTAKRESISIASVVRGMIDADMGPGMTEAIGLVNELLEQGMTQRAIAASIKFPKGTRVRWKEITGTVTAVVGLCACMICDDTADLTDPHVEFPLLSDLVKIGGQP